jgi:hypothetical protein
LGEPGAFAANFVILAHKPLTVSANLVESRFGPTQVAAPESLKMHDIMTPWRRKVSLRALQGPKSLCVQNF